MTTDGDGDDIIVSMPVSMSVPMPVPVPMFMVKPMTMSFGQRCGYSFLTILLCRDSMAECKQQQKPKDRDRKRKFLLAKKRFSCATQITFLFAMVATLVVINKTLGGCAPANTVTNDNVARVQRE
ncbi:hypothetical protein RUM44_000045 [Polyplax serrata]|uniref:Transmembrane protein n=1 Tax=Polyplax serrata TaxID=468196 RepID=A0ABR1B4D1_POLSC